MYVRCVKCDWSQDDFWDKDYNPFEKFSEYETQLVEALAKPTGERAVLGVPLKEWIFLIISKIDHEVENMKWLTHQDFVDDPNPLCPRCSCGNLTVD